MKWIIYLVYNVVSLKLITFILGYLNTYLNSTFIPGSFRWGVDGKLKEDQTLFGICQYAISNIEVLILIFPLYFLNRWYLSHYVKAENISKILYWTILVCLVALLIWIFRYFYFIYK